MSIILLIINIRHRSGNGNHQNDSSEGQNKRSRWPIHCKDIVHFCHGYGHVFGNFIWLRVLAHKGRFFQTDTHPPIHIYTFLLVCECAGFGLMSTLVNMGVQLKASNKAENRKITQRLSLGRIKLKE